MAATVQAPSENARPRPMAENKGPGSQYLVDGLGDQNVASGTGVVYKIGHQINVKVEHMTAKGIPSLLDLPPQFLNGLRADGSPTSENVVDWLMRQPENMPLDLQQHQLELFSQVAEGTGKWILETNEFVAWKEPLSPSRFLWMDGMLGSGKSMLVSLIVDTVHKEIELQGRDNVAACAYFYFQEGERHRVPLARIWATLLAQLLSRKSAVLSSELKAKFYDPLRASSPLDSSEYLILFKAQAATVKTVYLIIDALDSCQNAHGEETQRGVQEALKALPDGIKVLFTSRTDWVGRGIRVDQRLSITPTKEDVKTYVKRRIAQDLGLRGLLEKSPGDQEEITSEVTNMTLSSRMFLLARLHMDNLSKGRTLVGIKTALRQLPDSAFEAFERSARRIAEEQKHSDNFDGLLAKHVLTWVMHAETKLNAEQILDSFAVQKSKGQRYQGHRPLKELLMHVCVGLVVMDPEKKTLGLAHKSVQIHLRNYQIIPEKPDLEIAKTCLYLLVDPGEDQEGEPPLLQYAATYWGSHLGRDGQQEVDAEAESLTLKFLKNSAKLTRAFRAMDGGDHGRGTSAFDGMTGLHAAVHFNLLSWAERLIASNVIDVDAECADGQTALHWAVRYGRRELVELLVRKSANPNIRDRAGDTPLCKALIGPTASDTPLYQAVTRSAADDEAVVEALVRGNARLDMRNSKGLSPLSSAIRYGPTSIARIMVKSQDDVNAEIFEGWTSLRLVFYHGQDIIAHHPPQSGTAAAAAAAVAVNRFSSPGNTEGWDQPRHVVRNHAYSLTDLLLERGVNLNRPSAKDGWTPLVYAAKTGDISKLHRLLTREPDPADVHLRDRDGKSPLGWAISYGKAAAVQLLVEHGANVNETYGDVRSTPLIEAVKSRGRDTVWVLLNAGARPNDRDAHGASALLYAVKNQDRDLIWLLISKGASAVDSEKSKSDDDSRKPIQSALELAMAKNDFSVAWLLCEHGASPTTADEGGVTPLHGAAKAGRLEAARFLISRGATASLKDATGSTPVHYAVLGGHVDVVALLAAQEAPGGSRLDTLDAHGNTALVLATLMARLAAMRVLLRHGASCNVPDVGGRTALHHAASKGFNDGLRLLLRDGHGDPNAADGERFTPLHHAVSSDHAGPETVSVLAAEAHGANLEAQDKHGRTPLMLAAQLGKEPLVRCLIVKGANVLARDERGYVAFDYAEKHPNIQQFLKRWRSPQQKRSH